MELENEEPKCPPTSRNLQSVELGPSSILAPIPLHPTSTIEPNVSLPDKFDGTRAQFRGVHKSDQAYYLATTPKICE